ncbi:hypothetical protein [uncultured Helicobacter sp.]|uniref:hypothetical protein n=1 Tax=uncultured Helicobacter sp. TaxID=175537 RepID=UPI00374FFCFB
MLKIHYCIFLTHFRHHDKGERWYALTRYIFYWGKALMRFYEMADSESVALDSKNVGLRI